MNYLELRYVHDMVPSTSSPESEHERMLTCFISQYNNDPLNFASSYCLRQRHQKIQDRPTGIEKVCIKHSLYTKNQESDTASAQLTKTLNHQRKELKGFFFSFVSFHITLNTL